MQDTARLRKEREVIFSEFAGAYFSWLQRLPVTQEVAGSSPDAQAAHTWSGRSDGTLGQVARQVNTSVYRERSASLETLLRAETNFAMCLDGATLCDHGATDGPPVPSSATARRSRRRVAEVELSPLRLVFKNAKIEVHGCVCSSCLYCC